MTEEESKKGGAGESEGWRPVLSPEFRERVRQAEWSVCELGASLRRLLEAPSPAGDPIAAMAAVICHADACCSCPSPAACRWPGRWEPEARAAWDLALATMREPSAAMVKAGEDALDLDDGPFWGVRTIWRAMHEAFERELGHPPAAGRNDASDPAPEG